MTECVLQINLSRKSAVQLYVSLAIEQPGPGECEDESVMAQKGYRWAFGDFDSATARSLKYKRSMGMLYGTIGAFAVTDGQVQYQEQLDLTELRCENVSLAMPAERERPYRNLFAQQDKLDWIGNDILGVGAEKQWRAQQPSETDETLTVVLDLSQYKSAIDSNRVFFALNLASGSGLAEDEVKKYAKGGLNVDFSAKIIPHENTMSTKVRTQYKIFQDVYSRHIGAEVSQMDRRKYSKSRSEFTYGEIVFPTFLPVLELAC